MKHKLAAARLIPAAICASPLIALAGQTSEPVMNTPPPANPWEFRITPYAWLTVIDGTSGPDGFTTDLDASFSDIADVLKMAAALQIEARYERWGFLADGFYANLGDSGHASGPEHANVDVDFKQFLGEFDILYRVCESSNHFADVYAGVRYNHLELDVDFDGPLMDRSGSATKDWADPIVGLRTQWNINDKWYLAGKGDIGGFGVNSDFTWNLQATVGYNFTPCVSAEIGYRYFDTDYDDGGFTYDIAQAGLLLGVNFRF
jgi:opacity protein-like surface antigen